MQIAGRFKSYFLRGLAVLLPTILTIYIFVWGYAFIRDNISIHINQALVTLTMRLQGVDPHNEAVRQAWTAFWVQGWGQIAGFLIALVGVCIVGALFASVVGRSLWRLVENFITHAPVVSKVYPYIKQITDFLLAQSSKEKLFTRVVGVEYPRKGIWSIGFVTGTGLKKISDGVEKKFLTVLVPTSPTPFTGFVIMVPKEETIELDITVEEALRFTVSAGVVTPAVRVTEDGSLVLPTEES